jgi:hypothetical protein
VTLVAEDGSGRPDSNTYAVVTDLKGYASLRCASIPPQTAMLEAALVQAMDALIERSDYLRGGRYLGRRVSATQANDWPRIGVWVENFPVAPTEIPRQLIYAQCALAIDILSGTDLMPTAQVSDVGPVVSETVGPITTVYANTGRVRRLPANAKADTLLRVLLVNSGLSVVRV